MRGSEVRRRAADLSDLKGVMIAPESVILEGANVTGNRSLPSLSQAPQRSDGEHFDHGGLRMQMIDAHVASGQGWRSLLKGTWGKRPTWLKTRPDIAAVEGEGKLQGQLRRRRQLSRDIKSHEMFANVMTSVPFLLAGVSTPRPSPPASLYGRSVVGVGLASSAYHMSRGKFRRIFRWGDYAMIAVSTMCLTRALDPCVDRPRLMLASAALLPFQPLAVTALHVALFETRFAKRALDNPLLRPAHFRHALATLTGGALYLADEIFCDHPYIHAGWHVAAAYGIHTTKELFK